MCAKLKIWFVRQSCHKIYEIRPKIDHVHARLKILGEWKFFQNKYNKIVKFVIKLIATLVRRKIETNEKLYKIEAKALTKFR